VLYRCSSFQFPLSVQCVRVGEQFEDGVEVFKFSGETAALALQGWDVRSQVGVCTFDCESVIFALGKFVNARKVIYVRIPLVAVGKILFCVRCFLHHFLDCVRMFVPRSQNSDELARFSGHRRQNVQIFFGFGLGALADEVIQFV